VLCEVLNSHLNGLSGDEFATLKSLLQRVLLNTKGGAASTPVGSHPTSIFPPLLGATDAR